MRKRDERTVWERVREALRDAGKPDIQRYAAKVCGIKQPSVAEWNQRGGYPTIENAVSLSRETGVCVQWLYNGVGPKYPGDIDDVLLRQLLGAWPNLIEPVKQRIVGYGLVSLSNVEAIGEKKQANQAHPQPP